MKVVPAAVPYPTVASLVQAGGEVFGWEMKLSVFSESSGNERKARSCGEFGECFFCVTLPSVGDDAQPVVR